MKLLGAAIIIVVCTVMGFMIANRYVKRAEQLRILMQSFKMFETELMFGHTPLHQAMERVSKYIEGPISKIFEQFSRSLQEKDADVDMVWENSLRDHWTKTALNNRDFDILLQFGKQVGKYDVSSEQKNIHYLYEILVREEKEAEITAAQQSKMMRSLGFLSGILIVILLF